MWENADQNNSEYGHFSRSVEPNLQNEGIKSAQKWQKKNSNTFVMSRHDYDFVVVLV